MKQINVVAAVIQFDEKILCVQRGPNKYDYISKKFEFPGGKIEKGESEQQALAREIREELKKEILVKKKLLVVDHEYPDFKIFMHTYLCYTTDDKLQLTEHISFKWLSIPELDSLDWAAADIPIVNTLIELHADNKLS